MSRVVLITVRLYEGRYHGTGDEPPSPARLFQALVAGVGLSGQLNQQDCEALTWLEKRQAPVIASPSMEFGQRVTNYVPNNDFDAVQGDPRRIGSIRTQKIIRPRLFDAAIPFLYAWTFDVVDENEDMAKGICTLAERLYQFGRGVDLAWAWGEALDVEVFEEQLLSYPGVVYRPSEGGSGRTVACPRQGSLASLKARYAAGNQRFKAEGRGKAAKQLFSQPPKPLFVPVAYDSPPSRQVYEIQMNQSGNSFAVWPLARASMLVVSLRDLAVKRLQVALPNRSSEIERVLIGRTANGADHEPTSIRVKIVPLPSIGHHYADHGIRRVLVLVPAGCPLRADDVHWAFSGLELVAPDMGADQPFVITPTADESMCVRFGIGDRPFRVWRTVTPVALPESTRRRRIDPDHMIEEAKSGAERAAEQARAAGAVVQALRFAEIRARAESIRVQREPFEANGERVEAFAPGTRFAKERLWHVAITFKEPITGPLIIGDGRFFGLGVMVPNEHG
jgi:CRISPR-associated protein Csb2